MRKKNNKIVEKNIRAARTEKIKSIPMPEIPLEELLDAVVCAQACANYPEYNPGDNTLNKNK